MATFNHTTLGEDFRSLMLAMLPCLILDRKGREPGNAQYEKPRYKVYQQHPDQIRVNRIWGAMYFYQVEDGETAYRALCTQTNTIRCRVGLKHLCGDDMGLDQRQLDLLRYVFRNWREPRFNFTWKNETIDRMPGLVDDVRIGNTLTVYHPSGNMRLMEFQLEFDIVFSNSIPIIRTL